MAHREQSMKSMLRALDNLSIPVHVGGWLLLVLPACFMAAAFWLRAQGGPAWLWFNLDPDYYYLLDALNVLNLTTPGHVYHPGTTVDWLGALILKVAYLGADAKTIITAVLNDPEHHLRLIGGVFVLLNGLAVLALGLAGYRVSGRLPPALLLQLAPGISMLVLKSAFHVKPEALLLASTLVLATVSVLSLKDEWLNRHPLRFAIAFGVVAGFGVATKITAAPVFVLPVLVLYGVGIRAVIVYGVVALAALIVFTLPALAAYDVFFDWMAKVSQGSGAYGGGGPFDWTVYSKNIAKLFKRPAFSVVFVLSGIALVWAAVRHRQARPLPGAEVRLLAGIWIAQGLHVLVVAKQPNVLYMLPSFVLIPLAIVVLFRLTEARETGFGRTAFIFLLALVVVAEGAGISRFAKGVKVDAEIARGADNGRFGRCARVYSYAASSPSYALFLADFVTGARFSGELKKQGPDNDFWLEHYFDQRRVVFRDWQGRQDMKAVLERYPCAVFRGTHWRVTEPLLQKIAPGLSFDGDCSTRHETIKTQGVDCQGATQ